MGKWTTFKKDLPRFALDATYQQKVDALKEKFAARDTAELGAAYNDLREEKDQLEAALTELNAQLEALSQILVTRLEDQGLSSIKLETGESFLVRDEPYTSVKDKAALRGWISEHGLDDLLSVQWQTLNAMVKSILEDPLDPETGQPKALPAGIELFMRTSLIRKKQ